MRSHLFCDQNRHLVLNLIFLCHNIRSCIRSDGKFSKRQRIMVMKNIAFDILFRLLLVLEIAACILCNLSIFKCNLQITVLQFIEIYFTYIQHSVCPLQYRRSKYFSDRNIDIRHAAFENSLFRRV